MREENLHKGHRERMRQRYLTEGGEGFADHELLEMLLYGAVPRGDTNALAHKMIAEFGSLTALLEADPVEIARRCGVKESTAVLISLQKELMRRRNQEKWKEHPALDSVRKAGAYALDLMGDYHYERFYVACLDSRKRLIRTCFISEGTVDESVVHPRVVVETVLKYQASSVILMHNHPGGTMKPSFSDLELTTKLCRILREIGIEVADHIIVSENAYFSFLEHNYLKET
ncbi:DNA repair protein RadC [Anaerotignum lactatifermentans]|uniref:DNA repair protein RadC n=1 Tax=Anaerotignum lactatifermentans TaxID=160404 RepID=A0ABS2G7N9_9FIRM|nr:DNA repair protein RadC [Anaerotignum lactatifermentans]MBM6829276.1 DNA repair protein RadC [Anaerotignum lactatifermentans]MBM6877484.1 DNA repair protein RadC [Anaerotignum lactatifermentans]MBM6950854.1 DNA repair protein RadC [Anaerotignum lactatifermentans]